jgi:hypothetical protein
MALQRHGAYGTVQQLGSRPTTGCCTHNKQAAQLHATTQFKKQAKKDRRVQDDNLWENTSA